MVYQIKQQCLWGGANFDRENVNFGSREKASKTGLKLYRLFPCNGAGGHGSVRYRIT